MAAIWYYKFGDREYGPISFEELFELAQSGRLREEDPIRLGDKSAWSPASSLGGLFPDQNSEADEEPQEVTSLDDLEIQIVNENDATGQPSPADMDEMAIQIVSEQDAPLPEKKSSFPSSVLSRNPMPASPPSSSAQSSQPAPPKPTSQGNENSSGEGEWYCEVVGMEFGPMSFEELIGRAESGDLSLDDKVRKGEGGNWAKAEHVGEVYRAWPVEEDSAPPAPANSPPVEFPPGFNNAPDNQPELMQPWQGYQPMPGQPPVPPAGYAPGQPPVPYGGPAPGQPPAPYAGTPPAQPLAQEPTQPAATQPQAPQPQEPAYTPPAEPVIPESAANSTPPPVAPSKPEPSKPERSIPKQPKQESPDPVTPSKPEPAPPVSVAPKPKPPAPASSPPTPAAPAPTPKISRPRKSSGGGASLSMDFSGLGAQFKEHGTKIAVLGVLAAAFFLFRVIPNLTGSSGQAEYDVIHKIYTDFVAMRDAKASDGDFQSFVEKSRGELEPIVAKLEKTAGAQKPILQNLLWASRDSLLELLENSRTEPSEDEKDFLNKVEIAKRLLAGETMEQIRPPDRATGEQQDPS